MPNNDINWDPPATLYIFEAMRYYRYLADGLSDMVEEGRCDSLRKEDYNWVVEKLVKIAAADPGNPGYHTKP